MASCVQSITSKLTNETTESLSFIVPNEFLSVNFIGLSNTLIRLNLTQNDSIRFNINLSSSSGISNIQVSFYKIDRITKTYLALGSINSQDSFITFIKNLLEGEYIICLYAKNTSSYTGNIQGIFANFIPHAVFFTNGYTGNSAITNITMPINIKPCNKPLYYEIIEGQLPEGIQMTHSGTLYGILPNLDCMPSNTDLSPSANWFTQLKTGEGYPYGRQWRFKIRTTLLNYSQDIKDEKWISIRIYNNWDLEKDNFSKQLPFQKNYEIIIEEPEIILPISLCPDLICNINNSIIIDNNNSNNIIENVILPYSDIEYITIPFNINITTETFLNWYVDNLIKDFMLIDNSILENKNFINKLKESVLLRIICYKQGIIKQTTEMKVDYSYMNYDISIIEKENVKYLVLETNIKEKDEHGIERNEEDLDVIYLQNNLEINNTLEWHFVAWYGSYLDWK